MNEHNIKPKKWWCGINIKAKSEKVMNWFKWCYMYINEKKTESEKKREKKKRSEKIEIEKIWFEKKDNSREHELKKYYY